TQDASRHGRYDEDDGGGQTRPAGRGRPGHGDGEWDALAGTTRRDGEEYARGAAWRRRAATDNAENAAKHARTSRVARIGRKNSRFAGRSAARIGKEKMISDSN